MRAAFSATVAATVAVTVALVSAMQASAEECPKVPTCVAIQKWYAQAPNVPDNAPTPEFRRKALRESALAVAAQAGSKYRTDYWNEELEALAEELGLEALSFEPLLMDQGNVFPPSVLTATNEISIEGNTKRIVAAEYRIEEPARLVTTPPDWRDYLLGPVFADPAKPTRALLPETTPERSAWRADVVEGWQAGIEAADQELVLRMAEFRAAYVGRVRYRMLELRGMATAPYCVHSDRGVRGGGQQLRIGESIVRLVRQPRLVRKSSKWKALPQLPCAFCTVVGSRR